MDMLANEIFDKYFEALLETPRVWEKFNSSPEWTVEATRALTVVGCTAFPTGTRTAKGHRDSYNRSEYLTLDVCVTDPKTWGPPLFAAEHENSPWRAKIQYCAWKLLATEARRRVLVAYFDSTTNVKSAKEIEDAIHEVCEGNPGKDLLVIAGDYNGKPTSADALRNLHTTLIIGVQR